MRKLTAQELIYMAMIRQVCINDPSTEINDYVQHTQACETFEDIWSYLKDRYDLCIDVECDFREGISTELTPKTSSRHYEIDVVVRNIDGVWVAWDFYYGGGKFGEPESFDWISNARIVNCEENVVTKVEYIFKEII